MAVQKSDQITNNEAFPPVANPPGTIAAEVRRTYFSKTIEAGNLGIGDTLELVQDLPVGGRIVGGHVTWEAMTTGAGAATMELGDGTTAAKYLEATSVDAAGSTSFADTIARNFGERISARFKLIATASVEAWAAGQKIAGYIDVMTD